MMEEPSPEREHREVTYMDDIVPRVLILRILLWTAIISVSLCVIAYLILIAREHAIRPDGRFPERYLPAPHEVANVRQEPFAPAVPAASMFDDEHVLLRSYGWVDRDKHLVRIPVERAVELMLARPGGGGGQP